LVLSAPASATSSFTSLNRLTEDDLGFLEPILDAQSNNHGDEYTRIDELQLASGMERTIEVCYCPLIEPATDDYRAGRFTKRNFRLFFSFSRMCSIDKDHTTVQYRAKVATSFIEMIPNLTSLKNSRCLQIFSWDVPSQTIFCSQEY
jgi:hypothetical protein